MEIKCIGSIHSSDLPEPIKYKYNDKDEIIEEEYSDFIRYFKNSPSDRDNKHFRRDTEWFYDKGRIIKEKRIGKNITGRLDEYTMDTFTSKM